MVFPKCCIYFPYQLQNLRVLPPIHSFVIPNQGIVTIFALNEIQAPRQRGSCVLHTQSLDPIRWKRAVRCHCFHKSAVLLQLQCPTHLQILYHIEVIDKGIGLLWLDFLLWFQILTDCGNRLYPEDGEAHGLDECNILQIDSAGVFIDPVNHEGSAIHLEGGLSRNQVVPGKFLIRKSIHNILFFSGLLGLPCFHFNLQVIGLFQLVDLRMGLFIWVIAVDTQVFLVLQIVYGSTVIGKAVRFHGAVHILQRGFFCFSQSMVVASLVKAVLKMVVDNNLIPGSCFILCIPEHSGSVCAKLRFLGIDGLFRFVVDGKKRILPALGTALHGSRDSHIVLIPQLLHNLLQTACRETAHFHTATGGNGAGYKLESQLRRSHLGVLTVNFKEVPHLIQNDIIRVAFLDTVVCPHRWLRLSIFHGMFFFRHDFFQIICQDRRILYPEPFWRWIQF